ncbi:hypothetical protein M8818_005191 [Zalaria obscura]|uniref:Uncharacterized protein n=1 Tax=Zalaria obscura TaxID=2024903 RepID=A0ACC3SCU0_9PEZI
MQCCILECDIASDGLKEAAVLPFRAAYHRCLRAEEPSRTVSVPSTPANEDETTADAFQVAKAEVNDWLRSDESLPSSPVQLSRSAKPSPDACPRQHPLFTPVHLGRSHLYLPPNPPTNPPHPTPV